MRAPELDRVIRILFRVREDPGDRRARIQLGLLERRGATACPSCGARFSLEGFSETRTGYHERRMLTCAGCGTGFLLGEREIA